jgi:hypothetical protein
MSLIDCDASGIDGKRSIPFVTWILGTSLKISLLAACA